MKKLAISVISRMRVIGILLLMFSIGGLTFERVDIPIGGLAPGFIAAADFNTDGFADLAVTYLRCDPDSKVEPCNPQFDKAGRVLILLGSPDGFKPLRRYTVGDLPRNLVAADVNNDGHLDIVVANTGYGLRGSLSVLLGDGEGAFVSACTPARTCTPTDGLPYGMTAADFNGDGKIDLAISNTNGRTVGIWFGHGNGWFTDPQPYWIDAPTIDLASGDFNGDGHPDIIVASLSKARALAVLINDGSGSFAVALIPHTDAPFGVAICDMDKDNKLDLVTAQPAGTIAGFEDHVAVWRGDGQGGFQLSGRFYTLGDPLKVTCADFNGDGNLDVAAANGVDDAVSVLLGDGKGGLGECMGVPVGKTPLSVITADFKGKAQIITANQSGNSITILFNEGR